MRTFAVFLAVIFLLAPSAALAHLGHVSHDAAAQTDEVETPPEPEATLSAEVQGELLPGDGFRFGLETAWFHIQRAFTFQAERKAELDEERLERLEIKISACAELGDERCVQRLEEMIARAQERAQRHLERKAEVLEQHRQRFEELKVRHAERRQELQEKAAARREKLQELKELRRQKLDEFREKRLDRLEALKQERPERGEEAGQQRELRQEQREQNREQLIELRSENVKNRLDATRENVESYQRDFNNVAQ